MSSGSTVFTQIVSHAPKRRYGLVKKYKRDHNTHKFSCWDQFLCISFSQLTYRNGLRDIEACLNAQPKSSITWVFMATQHQMPIKKEIGEFTLILLKLLISEAREHYQDEQPFSIELENTVIMPPEPNNRQSRRRNRFKRHQGCIS
ncbi:DUF4372 domain-containing protein [bacterium]|nr:DUF4372 domain-containing protein [bacterium]